ncbi:PAN domain protein [Cooperia oncophora]
MSSGILWSKFRQFTVPDKPCFVRTRQRYLVGFEEKTTSGIDLRTCLQNCLQTVTFYCASVNYNEYEKLINSPSDYYENECSPEQNSDHKVSNSTTSRSAVAERCFAVYPNTMLLNLESHLLQRVSTLEQCQEECLKRSGVKGIRPCGALNWIPHARSCMLFEVGFDRQLIVPSSHVQFIVNKCTGKMDVKSSF